MRRWREEPWQSLRPHVREPMAYEIPGRSGVRYQFEVEVFWDDEPEGNLRVIVTADDGKGWRTLRPMRTDDFIKGKLHLLSVEGDIKRRGSPFSVPKPLSIAPIKCELHRR